MTHTQLIEKLIEDVERNKGGWKSKGIAIIDTDHSVLGVKGDVPQECLDYYLKFPISEMHEGDSINNSNSFLMRVTEKTAVIVVMKEGNLARLSAINLRGRICALSDFLKLDLAEDQTEKLAGGTILKDVSLNLENTKDNETFTQSLNSNGLSEKSDLIDLLKRDLHNFGAINGTGIALLTIDGRVIYSDLSNDIQEKIMLIKPTFLGLTVGSSITLEPDKQPLVIMRASQETIISVKTQRIVGFTIIALTTLIKRYKDQLDDYVKTVFPQRADTKPEALTTEATPTRVINVPAEKIRDLETIEKIENGFTEEKLEVDNKTLRYKRLPPLSIDNLWESSLTIWFIGEMEKSLSQNSKK
jgi:hypothetical protein